MVIVSVILPTYNGKKEWISQSIDSVLNQTFKDFELIIINDCSNNEVEKTILEYKEKDSRIVYIKNEKNLKLTKTLNKGINYAKGKYIARIDDDDIRKDNYKLKKQYMYMEQNGDCGLCGAGNQITINEEGKLIGTMKMRINDEQIRSTMLQGCQFIHSSVLIRRQALNDVGIYDPIRNMVEDYELWCRIGLKYKFYNIKDISLIYRINSKGISQKNRIRQNLMSFKVFMKYNKYYPSRIKALILRVGAFFLPDKVVKFIIRIIRK